MQILNSKNDQTTKELGGPSGFHSALWVDPKLLLSSCCSAKPVEDEQGPQAEHAPPKAEQDHSAGVAKNEPIIKTLASSREIV